MCPLRFLSTFCRIGAMLVLILGGCSIASLGAKLFGCSVKLYSFQLCVSNDLSERAGRSACCRQDVSGRGSCFSITNAASKHSKPAALQHSSGSAGSLCPGLCTHNG